MVSETLELEEKTPDDGSPVQENGTSKEDEKDSEMFETDISQPKEDPEDVESSEKEKEIQEEGEGSKKVKESRKRNSKKRGRESKKSGEESIEKKKRSRRSSSKEPVTPIGRPARERKAVEWYSASSEKAPATKGLSIEKGRGTLLKDIPNVAFKLSKRKPSENLQMLHTILFGKRTKTHSLKRNINQFSGFVWVENEEKKRAKVKEKLDKCVKEKLLDFCDVLNIPVSRATMKKEELAAKLLNFLESPHATTDVLLADKEQGARKHKRKGTTSTKKISVEASSETSAKERKLSPEVRKKRERSSKSEEKVEDEEKIDHADSKYESEEDDDNNRMQIEDSDQGESEPEEEDKPKEQMASKKGSAKKNAEKGSHAKSRDKSTAVTKGIAAKSVRTPAKSIKSPSRPGSKKGVAADDRSPFKSKGSTTRKQKDKKDSQKSGSKSAKDKITHEKQASKSRAKDSLKEQGKGKASVKAKSEPSREEMHAAVTDILKEVDFNIATLSDILRQLGAHFGVDLMHRKFEVKTIITDVINNMTDEEGEEEAEENPEAEDDVDEETDKDDDA